MRADLTETVIRDFFDRRSYRHGDAWRIVQSEVSGRGIVATRDLEPGDLIYRDIPVVLGPRGKTNFPVCVGCHSTQEVITCPKGCRLPVCSATCSESERHKKECEFLQASLPSAKNGVIKEWSANLLSAVTPLRCLVLSEEDKVVVKCLLGHKGKQHSFEARHNLMYRNCSDSQPPQVDLLKKELNNNLNAEDEEWLRHCCYVMDANAYEVVAPSEDGTVEKSISLRGLYPLSAIMNHSCSPNTRHIYSEIDEMIVCAARPIKAGEELTNCYCTILWDTPSRRLYLARTKHFMCRCDRCRDPTEFGSYLSGLKCPLPSCDGMFLPIDPLDMMTSWKCNGCSKEFTRKQTGTLMSMQGVYLKEVDCNNLKSIMEFLAEDRVPPLSQVAVQLKACLVWKMGYFKNFTWSELSIHDLKLKEKLCHELIELLNTLRTGESRIKGLLLMELYITLTELSKRQTEFDVPQEMKEEMCSTIAHSASIIYGDASAPREFQRRLTAHRDQCSACSLNFPNGYSVQ